MLEKKPCETCKFGYFEKDDAGKELFTCLGQGYLSPHDTGNRESDDLNNDNNDCMNWEVRPCENFAS